MSEEILKALIQLFALITKQDGGIGEKEIAYVNRFLIQQIGVESAKEYLQLYREANKERHREYMRDYMRQYRKRKKDQQDEADKQPEM